jgi:hypothetical protein
MQTSPPVRTRTTLQALSEKGTIEIAIDTEFKDAHTLTIQVATWLSHRQCGVQVYQSPAIEPPPSDFRLDEHLSIDSDQYGRFFENAVLRPTKTITPDLSPVRMLIDLFGLKGVEAVSRHHGQLLAAQAANKTQKNNNSGWTVPAIRLVIIGHFLTADFGRMFGREFYAHLFTSQPDGEQALAFSNRKVIGLAYPGSPFARAPIVEYALDSDGNLYQIRLETRDTQLALDPKASLDDLSRTFLGRGKDQDITAADKQDMLRTFREKPREAYAYAIRDVVNTLLIHEQMQVMDADIYESFGVTGADIPPMKATVGSRNSHLMVHMTARAATGSTLLAKDRALKNLMKKGGLLAFGGERAASRFGLQTGQFHGGLSYSRTPTRLWDQAPGMLADVDMASCYSRIISNMNVYWGRPVVHESGNKTMTLSQAVRFLSKSCQRDAWYIRVSGEIKAGYNALIPSTRDAITEANYRRNRPKNEDRSGAKLFFGEINSGVVTGATWAMIQALPPALRQEYEALSAESLVFYPHAFVASDGIEYDRLVEQLGLQLFPWSADIDLESRIRSIEEPIDADYVSLRFGIGDLARAMIDRREQAKQRDGKKSGSALGWKLMANNLYGVLGSEHFPTGNAVAANVITATARAGAFALVQSLNGYQVITDGCTYRRDQIPACTYADCLRLQPDYPIHRAEAGGPIPFLDPADVPSDDAEFTAWYRDRNRCFFEVEGDTANHPFTIHALEHKQTAGRTSFDALACMGAADYVKCNLQPDGSWAVEEKKLRGHTAASTEQVCAWILATLPNDHLETLPPVTTDTRLLKVNEAKVRARQFLRGGASIVALPLGHQDIRVRTYGSIRLSAFIPRDAQQLKSLLRQVGKFLMKHRTGLEILALKRGYGDRPTGSLTAVARSFHEHIQTGKRDFTKKFHLTQLPTKLEEAATTRMIDATRLKEEASDDLFARIAAIERESETLFASILCTDAKAAPLDLPTKKDHDTSE